MRKKNKKNTYLKKPEEKNNKVVTNNIKLGFMMAITSIFSFIFSLFKKDTKKVIIVKKGETKNNKTQDKENEVLEENNVKTQEKETNVLEENKDVTDEKENVKSEEKGKKLDESEVVNLEEDKKSNFLFSINKPNIIPTKKTEEEEFEIAKKVVYSNSLENKKMVKNNTTVSKLKIIKQALKYISLSELLFKHKQIKELVSSVSINNTLRSIRNKKNLDLRGLEYKKIKLKNLNNKINQNSRYQIDMCKLEINDPTILNEIAYIEQSLHPQTLDTIKTKDASKVYKR